MRAPCQCQIPNQANQSQIKEYPGLMGVCALQWPRGEPESQEEEKGTLPLLGAHLNTLGSGPDLPGGGVRTWSAGIWSPDQAWGLG